MNKQNITINEAQKMVDEWIKTIGVRYFSELTNMVVLTEEVGETGADYARKYGDQSFKNRTKNTTLPTKWPMYFGCSFALPTKPESI